MSLIELVADVPNAGISCQSVLENDRMLGFSWLLMTVSPVVLNVPVRIVDPPAICWIKDVIALEKGVRIYFNRRGGPLFVSVPDRIFKPDDAPIDPARPHEAAVEVALGDQLQPTNSPEDGCTLVVVTRDGRIGVDATAHFYPTAVPSQIKTEFIPAHDSIHP